MTRTPQCAAVVLRSYGECAWRGAKRPCTEHCWQRHLDGAESASGDVVEVDAQAVVRASVGVVVEGARAVGWREAVYSVSRGVRLSLRVRLGVSGGAWASLIGVLGAMSAGRGCLAGGASVVVA